VGNVISTALIWLHLSCWSFKHASTQLDEVDALQELHMTGCMLMADDFCLVIAEGSLKSHKKYNRLMLNRIDWNQSLEEEPQGQLLCRSDSRSLMLIVLVSDYLVVHTL